MEYPISNYPISNIGKSRFQSLVLRCFSHFGISTASVLAVAVCWACQTAARANRTFVGVISPGAMSRPAWDVIAAAPQAAADRPAI